MTNRSRIITGSTYIICNHDVWCLDEETPLQRPSILMLDQDRDFIAVSETALRASAMRTIHAGSVRVALDLVRAAHFDLLVLDWEIPEPGRGRVLHSINELRVPVLVVSERSDVESQLEALQAGADDYLVKPISPVEPVHRVRPVLQRNAILLAHSSIQGPGGIELNHPERPRTGSARSAFAP